MNLGPAFKKATCAAFFSAQSRMSARAKPKASVKATLTELLQTMQRAQRTSDMAAGGSAVDRCSTR